MTNRSQRSWAGWTAAAFLLAAGALASDRLILANDADQNASAIVARWPDASRLTALGMIQMHGEPQKIDENALTWFSLYRGKRTVVHRSAAGEPMIEQVVDYRVPADKVAALEKFDGRVTVDRAAVEMSARTDDERTNFLVLNLAHEIASGFTTVSSAKVFYIRQQSLADAGKTSRYRDELIFAAPKPYIMLRDPYEGPKNGLLR
jgi:hypothetical protein